ncbi:hypothetical protein TWF481_002433 [Arthrobotrys musiformis]|uniref:SET domain-containing protein n=1 Tax=Arthrobotrys musiformis TaxID=47236 RepID=A0AAV9VV73_9PEZI
MPKRRRAPSPQEQERHQEYLADDVPEVHRRLLEHVLANNARLSKVKIAKLPHGIGIVASERIGKNEEITFIPTPLLINLHDIPFPNSSPLDHPTKIHSSLAAYIASKLPSSDAFISILPPAESFKSSLPLFWPDKILQNSPPWIQSFVQTQRQKLSSDYAHALKWHDHVDFTREEYECAWAAVNTRTIYYRPKKWYKIPAEDCMTMCPFIDYFNHDARGAESCTVTFSPDGLRVTTQKSYTPGEEIFVTYGDYNNDHLLVEYGFTLPQNHNDNIILTPYLTPLLSPLHQKILKEASFTGEYILDEKEICYKTLTALRISVIPPETPKSSKLYKNFLSLLDGKLSEDEYAALNPSSESEVSNTLSTLIKTIESDATSKTAALNTLLLDEEFTDHKASIESAIERWGQYMAIITAYRENQS